VRKISSEVRLSHLVYNPHSSGCASLLVTGSWKAPEPPAGPPRGPISVSTSSHIWRTSSEFTVSEYLAFTVYQPNALVLINTDEKGKLVRFHNDWYWADSDLSSPDIDALLRARNIRKKQSVERAKSLAALGDSVPNQSARGAIPSDLKNLVWERDRGACVNCGARTELQFDHVIPIALGGATSAENLQILCGPCNRTKGASIG
jgi:hypothetical protein